MIIKKKKNNYHPILTKQGYQSSPSIQELAKLTEQELKYVDGFRIWN